eukprot:15477145-Alexandrium_andersonii.AAC.1
MCRRRGRAKGETSAALEGAVREAFRAVPHVPRPDLPGWNSGPFPGPHGSSFERLEQFRIVSVDWALVCQYT